MLNLLILAYSRVREITAHLSHCHFSHFIGTREGECMYEYKGIYDSNATRLQFYPYRYPRLTDSIHSEHLVVKLKIRNDVEYKPFSRTKEFR